MYWHGVTQKPEEFNYRDLVCMALAPEVCNVIVDKQRVTPIGCIKGNRFCECESRLFL